MRKGREGVGHMERFRSERGIEDWGGRVWVTSRGPEVRGANEEKEGRGGLHRERGDERGLWKRREGVGDIERCGDERG